MEEARYPSTFCESCREAQDATGTTHCDPMRCSEAGGNGAGCEFQLWPFPRLACEGIALLHDVLWGLFPTGPEQVCAPRVLRRLRHACVPAWFCFCVSAVCGWLEAHCQVDSATVSMDFRAPVIGALCSTLPVYYTFALP